MRGLFDGAFFATLITRLVLDRAAELAAGSEVQEIPMYGAIRALTIESGRLVGSGAQAASSVDEAGRELWAWLTSFFTGH